MIREIDLLSYLPPFMQEYREFQALFSAENPEFMLVWKAAEKLLNNEFIATADEYGISKFEKLLNILPNASDSLEDRRFRVQMRWFDYMPYTLRSITQKIESIPCEQKPLITHNFNTGYTLTVMGFYDGFGQVEELDRILLNWVPCNIVIHSVNTIYCNSNGDARFCGGICFVNHFIVSNDFKETYIINGDHMMGGGVVDADRVFTSNDYKESVITSGALNGSGGIVSAHCEQITNDSIESSISNASALSGGGAVFAEFVEIK